MFLEKNKHQQDHFQEIFDPILDSSEVKVWVKRDDLVSGAEDLAFCGNKWWKLKYNLLHAKAEGHSSLLTFGGAYSNHIAAVASAGKQYNFKTIGLIRGQKVLPLNPTLQFALEKGMKLHFLSRTEYRQKNEKHFLKDLKEQYGSFYLIPEGGTNQLALKGTKELGCEILSFFDQNGPEYITVCCGTGGTVAGIISATNESNKVLGFSVLKGDFLTEEVSHLMKEYHSTLPKNWSIQNDYHFGGYAKFNSNLIDFINWFAEDKKIQLDPIYTGKMMYGLWDLIKKGFFPKNSRIVAIHSGGLQGIAGFNQRFDNLIKTK